MTRKKNVSMYCLPPEKGSGSPMAAGTGMGGHIFDRTEHHLTSK